MKRQECTSPPSLSVHLVIRAMYASHATMNGQFLVTRAGCAVERQRHESRRLRVDNISSGISSHSTSIGKHASGWRSRWDRNCNQAASSLQLEHESGDRLVARATPPTATRRRRRRRRQEETPRELTGTKLIRQWPICSL